MRHLPRLLLIALPLMMILAGCSEDYETAGDTASEEAYAYFEDAVEEAFDEYADYEGSVENEAAPPQAAGEMDLATGGAVQDYQDDVLAEERPRDVDGAPAGDEDQPTTTTETLGLERMMVYETEMTVVVDDLDEGRDKLEELIDAHHKPGVTDVIITSVDVTRIAGVAGSVTFEIRCHKDERQELIRELRDLGEIAEEYSTAEDVTRQYVDAERLRDRLQREYDILKAEYDDAVERGASAEELRELDRRLNEMDYNLSEAEGRLKNFDDLVTLPKISITLTEDEPGTTFRGDRVIADGFEMAYIAIVNILRVFVVIIGVVLALAALGVPTFLLARWIVRLLRRGGE